MKPSIDSIKDTPWYGISWKSLNDIVNNNTINYTHTEVRSDIMNHPSSRAVSHIVDKIR